MKERASNMTRTLPAMLVRSADGYGGYWGRGKDIAEAIKNAQWLGSQDKVYVMECDEAACIGQVSGELKYNQRGPIYIGKIMANSKDVIITEIYQPENKQ